MEDLTILRDHANMPIGLLHCCAHMYVYENSFLDSQLSNSILGLCLALFL